MTSSALTFLSTLWSNGLPEGGRLVLAIKRDGKMGSEFFSTVEEAAVRAMNVGARTDTYIGMAAQPPLDKGRGSTATALAIPGLWLDLDFEKGFKDMDGVRRFLAALPLQPSLLVASGGGIHAHWLFDGWMNCQGTSLPAQLELGWLRYCREVAKIELKAELDAVADLARVLRIPGTYNFKRQPSTEVVIVELNDTRFTPDSFDQWRAEQRTRTAGANTASFDFMLQEGAQPPYQKWQLAIEYDADLLAVYEHRKKMPMDSSLSGYDLSLATRLDNLDWTPQEVVNTIISHRTLWMDSITDPNTLKDPLKLNDPSYYERLLRKARAANDGSRATAAASQLATEVVEELEDLAGAPVDDSQRGKWFRAIFELIGIEVVDLWAVDRIEGKWHLRVRCIDEMRDIPVAPPDLLLSWQFWKRAIMISGTNVETIPKKEPAQLHNLTAKAGIILRVLPKQGVRQVDELVAYLMEIADNAPQYEQANILERQPFRRVDSGPVGIAAWGAPEECLFVRPDMMFFDIKTGRAPKLENLRHTLVEIGFVSRIVAARLNDDAKTTRKYLALPMARLYQLQSEAGMSGDRQPFSDQMESDDETIQ